MIETKWVLAAGFEPARGMKEPADTQDWQEAVLAGWKPAGPSLQVAGPQGVFVFAMVQRERPTLRLPGEVS